MAGTARPIARGTLDLLALQQKRERDAQRKANSRQQTPTHPIYNPDFPDDSVEGQIALHGAPRRPWYYADGAWQPLGPQSFAICDNDGVGSISLPDNTVTVVDLAGGHFYTNDSELFTLEVDTNLGGQAYGKTSISIHAPGAYRVDAGITVQRATSGMTLAQAQATWVGLAMQEDGISGHHANTAYWRNDPSGAYGFEDPFGVGVYWWSPVTTWYWQITETEADITTRPIYLKVKHISGFSGLSIVNCTMEVTKILDTVLI